MRSTGPILMARTIGRGGEGLGMRHAALPLPRSAGTLSLGDAKEYCFTLALAWDVRRHPRNPRIRAFTVPGAGKSWVAGPSMFLGRPQARPEGPAMTRGGRPTRVFLGVALVPNSVQTLVPLIVQNHSRAATRAALFRFL
jgi:hypothetical protein